MNTTREELGVAIQQAHAHKLKLTGHLCSVTWPEAVALGIDDFEHGPVFTDTEFVADKKPDVCPADGGRISWAKQDVNGAQVQEMGFKHRQRRSHRDMVRHEIVDPAPGRPTLLPRTRPRGDIPLPQIRRVAHLAWPEPSRSNSSILVFTPLPSRLVTPIILRAQARASFALSAMAVRHSFTSMTAKPRFHLNKRSSLPERR